MMTTTPALLRADFITQVRGINPRHVEQGSRRWRHVVSRDDVPGPEIRNYHMVFGDGQPHEAGIYGQGIEYEAELRVWTSYGWLSPNNDDSIITEDGNQVWLQLQTRLDPIVAGLISVQYQQWEEEDEAAEDEARRWGAHVLEIRYLAPHTA